MPPDLKVRTPAREGARGRHPYSVAQTSYEQVTSSTTYSPAPANDYWQTDLTTQRPRDHSWSEEEGEQWRSQQRSSGLPALSSIHDFLSQQQGPVEGAPRTEHWQSPHAAGREHAYSPTLEVGRPHSRDEDQVTSYHPASQDYGATHDLRGAHAEEFRGYGSYHGAGGDEEGYSLHYHHRFTPSYSPPSTPQLSRPEYGNRQSILHPAPSHQFDPSPHGYPAPDYRSYPPFGQPFRRSSAPELSFIPNVYQHHSPQYLGAYRPSQHAAPSSNHSFTHHANDSPLSSPHAESSLPSSRNTFPSPPSTSSGPNTCPPPSSDSDNLVLAMLCHRANLYPTFGPEQLAIVWDGSLSRALAWDSPEARSLRPHPENELIVFGKGGWVGGLDKHGYAAFPRSAGKGANDWLRMQAEYCLCKRFKFWQGPKKVAKHPSVIRDHISQCAARDDRDPLARLCTLERTAEKRAKAAKAQREDRKRAEPALVSASTRQYRTPSEYDD